MTARDAAMRGFFQTLHVGDSQEDDTEQVRSRDKYTRPAPTAIFQTPLAGKHAATHPMTIGSPESTAGANMSTPFLSEDVPAPEPSELRLEMPGRAPIEMLQQTHYSIRAPPHGMPTRKPFPNPHAGPRFA